MAPCPEAIKWNDDWWREVVKKKKTALPKIINKRAKKAKKIKPR